MREKINDILFFLGLRFKRKLSVNSNAALIPSVCFLFDFKSKKKVFLMCWRIKNLTLSGIQNLDFLDLEPKPIIK